MSRYRSRTNERGVSHVSNVLECAMVMGWFAILVLGERAVSSATDARRYAETSAEQSATASSANQCLPQMRNVRGAISIPSVIPNGIPPASAAVPMILALGLGQQRTFPNYVKPLLNVLVTSSATADAVPGDVNPGGKQFEGLRDLGCSEKPLDLPMGSMDQYRQRLWQLHLQGYR